MELSEKVPVEGFATYTYGPFSASSNAGSYSEAINTTTIDTAGTSN